MNHIGPGPIWRLSTNLWANGHRRSARLLKFVNFVLFHAILPPEAHVGSRLTLGHFALGLVVHPNVSIGDDVTIWQQVTIATRTPPGGVGRIFIGDRAEIGAGARIVSPENGRLEIGVDSKIGAGAVITRDVPPFATAVGNPARIILR